MNKKRSGSKLLLQIEFFNNRAVALFVAVLQIFEVAAAIRYHLQKPAAAVLILQMLFEVAGELLDALTQNGNLHLCRASVGRVDGDLLYNILLLSLGEHDPYRSTSARFMQGGVLQ